MAASGSVFAKQFAGKIRQVGRDGDAVRVNSAGGGKAAAQIVAPAVRSKAGGAANVGPAAKAKAKAKAVQPARLDDGEGEEEDASGGVMTCANRGLLQQMLNNAGNAGEDRHDDLPDGSDGEGDGEGGFSMSTRLVPGTPKAGTQRRLNTNVPTITSPAGNRPPLSLGSMRAVASVSVVPTLAPNVKAVSSVSSVPPKVSSVAKVSSVSRMPPKEIGVTVSAPVPKVTSRPVPKEIGVTIAAPVPTVMTGPPQRTAVVTGPPRPGSRGGAPPVQSMLSPAGSRRPATPADGSTVGTPVRGRAGGTPVGRAGGTPVGGARVSSSYSGLHAKAKAAPTGVITGPPRAGGSVLPARTVRPSPFDMLREHDLAQSAKLAAANDDNADDAEAGNGEDIDGEAGMEAAEQDSFMMPPGSDASSADGDHRDRLADLDRTQPEASRRVQPTVGGSSSSSLRPAASAAPEAQESAADYVERVKKSMGVNSASAASQETPSRSVQAQPLSPCDSEDIIISAPQPKAVPAKLDVKSMVKDFAREERAREAVAASDPSPAAPQARSRSSDPRAAVAAARAVQSDSASSRAQSSDPRASKLDVKSMVKEFAREERAREVGFSKDIREDDDDSDDDRPVQAAAAGGSKVAGDWKLDVKSMVKDFAREERAREKAPAPRAVAAPNGKAPTPPPRPPKAPANSNAPAKRPSVPETEERQPLQAKQPLQAQENLPPGEQLFFSRKPRDVEFVPASLDDFKQKGYGKKEIEQLGTLGPDLDDEDLMMKRAVQEKKKQFSKELQKINRQRMVAASNQPAKPEAKPEAKPTARSKAQEFAKHVPKPKPPAVAKPPLVERKAKEAPQSEGPSEADEWDEIRRREKQHDADVLRVKDIKSFLGQL